MVGIIASQRPVTSGVSTWEGVPYIDREHGFLFLRRRAPHFLPPSAPSPAPSPVAAIAAAYLPRFSAPQAQLPSYKGPLGQHAAGSRECHNLRVRGSGQVCNQGHAEAQREQAEGVRAPTRNHPSNYLPNPLRGKSLKTEREISPPRLASPP